MPTARLDFEQGLVALAEEYGLGLKLDDRRFNRVRGEWFTIRGFDRERYRQERNRLFPDAPMHLPKHAMIASVMARPALGMAADVIAALRANGHRRAGRVRSPACARSASSTWCCRSPTGTGPDAPAVVGRLGRRAES